MSKKLKIQIKNIDNLEFEIIEDGTVGDYISINDVLDHDFGKIKEQIQGTVNEWKTGLRIEVIESEKKNWLNEYKTSAEFQQLVKENDKNKDELENFKKNQANERINWINEYKTSQEYQKLVKENDIYQNELDNLQKNHEIEKRNLINDFKTKPDFTNLVKDNQESKNALKNFQDNQVIQMENVISKFKNSNDYLDLIKGRQVLEDINSKHASDIEMVKLKEADKFRDQISGLENEKAILKSDLERRKTRNIKEMGEEFETWINNRYDETFSVSEDTELEKANKVIGGNKPDFIFKVLNDDKTIIESIVIEAKTQSNTGKTKNSDHFEKLDKDRKNYNGEYSLLISELEPSDEFIIKLIPGYQNMFVVRPGYFIPFLSLVKYIALKKKSIIQAEQNLKDKEEILVEFNDMKNDILENSVKNIQKNCQDILNNATKINDLSKKIEDSAKLVIDKHLETVRKKIDNFNITRITKKMEKLDPNN